MSARASASRALRSAVVLASVASLSSLSNLGCGHPPAEPSTATTPEAAPPSAADRRSSAGVPSSAPRCGPAEIPAASPAGLDPALEIDVGLRDATSPWSPLPQGLPSAPWLDTKSGFLLVPRPGPSADAPARWDVIQSRTGALVQTFEVSDPNTLPDDVARWLKGHALLDGADEVALRVLALPSADTHEGTRTDDASGWSTFAGMGNKGGDADLDPYFGVDIPDGCRWTLAVSEHTWSKSPAEVEIDWEFSSVTLWAEPTSGVALFSVVYLGQELGPDGSRSGATHLALDYRVLGGAS